MEMKLTIAEILITAALAGCASHYAQYIPPSPGDIALADARSLSDPGKPPVKVNDNWIVWCFPMAAHGAEICYAEAINTETGLYGPYAGGGRLRIGYLRKTGGRDWIGPSITINKHDYPGKSFAIRVNDGASLESGRDGILRGERANTALFAIDNGGVAHIGYWSWPEGPGEMKVKLDGAQEALIALHNIQSI